MALVLLIKENTGAKKYVRNMRLLINTMDYILNYGPYGH